MVGWAEKGIPTLELNVGWSLLYISGLDKGHTAQSAERPDSRGTRWAHGGSLQSPQGSLVSPATGWWRQGLLQPALLTAALCLFRYVPEGLRGEGFPEIFQDLGQALRIPEPRDNPTAWSTHAPQAGS